MTTFKEYNKDYFETLQQVWESFKTLYNRSGNKYQEVKRLASFVRMTARQVLKVNNLKDAVAEEMSKAQPSDVILRGYSWDARRLAEEKCYSMLWEDVSVFYDNAVAALNATKKPKTSDEIYQDAKQYFLDAEENIEIKPVQIDI